MNSPLFFIFRILRILDISTLVRATKCEIGASLPTREMASINAALKASSQVSSMINGTLRQYRAQVLLSLTATRSYRLLTYFLIKLRGAPRKYQNILPHSKKYVKTATPKRHIFLNIANNKNIQNHERKYRYDKTSDSKMLCP